MRRMEDEMVEEEEREIGNSVIAGRRKPSDAAGKRRKQWLCMEVRQGKKREKQTERKRQLCKNCHYFKKKYTSRSIFMLDKPDTMNMSNRRIHT